jgi:hypothetical protein
LIFKITHQQAQSIANAFRNAPLQYARLRHHQQLKYGKQYALILSVITRWGTQFRLVNSILRSKDALRAYALEPTRSSADLRANAITTLKDPTFWSNLDQLKDVLEPLDNQVRMAESTNAHIGTVLKRWKTVEELLKTQVNHLPELENFITTHFHPRFKRQVLDIHWVAYYLLPDNVNLPMDAEGVQGIIRFFDRQPFDSKNQPILADFLSFRAKDGIFAPTGACWSQANDPLRFWQLQAMFSDGLGNLAVRLFSTPANTVPSERAFSAQNLIHDKKRNRLSAEKTNKLVFIHMNQRLLDNIHRPRPSSRTNDDTAELCFEDELISLTHQDEGLKELDSEPSTVVHKRKPSTTLGGHTQPPSLRTQLTEEFAAL